MRENHLSQEKSPYLRQHRFNPVDWYPWSDAAFEKARVEQKLIFLSIGYSTCYWCHVMEKDSFEHEEVGAFLNEHFVSVKVDREEHPDVDDIYMDAILAITGHGGWPLSVFLTPDLRPIWGGTYFPRAQFLQILRQLSSRWTENPKELLTNSDRLFAHLREFEYSAPTQNRGKLLDRAIEGWKRASDPKYGGLGSAPKFPQSLFLRVLLCLGQGNPELLDIAENALRHMAAGGIYDQVGGGFHRYSTDEQWLVPHFEKMLYDNAMLTYLYADAFRLRKDPAYRQILEETIGYVTRDLRSPEGAFFAAEDAGEVGKEGEFYVWTYPDLAKVLDHGLLKDACELFGVSEGGNFEHGQNIFHVPEPIQLAKRSDPRFLELQKILLSSRSKRTRPHRDTKVLTSWNGLMIGALARAFQALGAEDILRAAQTAASAVKDRLWINGILFRRLADGESKYAGCLPDYAYLIQGLLDLYEADFSENWLLWARALQEAQNRLFLDSDGLFFIASRDEKNLILRKKDDADGALPSANAVSLGNLFRLARYFLDDNFDSTAQKLAVALEPVLSRSPANAAQFFLSMEYAPGDAKELIVAAKAKSADLPNYLRVLQSHFLPGRILALTTEKESRLPLLQGKKAAEAPALYVCESGSCEPPLHGITALEQYLSLRNES